MSSRAWTLLTVLSAGVGLAPAAAAAAPAGARAAVRADTGAADARISPDGKRIAFLAPAHGQPNLWVMGVDAPMSAARAVTADSARPVRDFAWSADGKSLLYLQDVAAGGVHLFLVPATGSASPAPRDLTPDGAARAQLVAVPPGTPGTVLVGLNDRDPAVHDLYRVDLASGTRTLVHKLDREVEGWLVDRDGHPRFAVRATGDSTTAIYEVDGEYLAPFTHTCGLARGCGPLHLTADGGKLYVADALGDADRTALYVYDLRSGRRSLVARNPHKRVDLAGAAFSDGLEQVPLVWFRENGDLKYYPLSDVGRRDLQALRREIPHGDLHFGTSSADERYHIVTVGSGPEAGATYLYDRVRGHVTLLYRGGAAPGQAARAAPGAGGA